MKRTALALLAIALVSFSIAGCTTLKPFTQAELDQISGFPASSQGR
jgi:outer membrane protein assembly factor BamE (lipoprotein component of BamABCDE complex)